jgi:uncharacterized protein YigA (DUF484 family)
MTHPSHTQPLLGTVTEADIADFLLRTPEFFERHVDLLTAVRLTSPYGARAVSLQERQAEMLRDKLKGLERRILDMMRNGTDNLLLADKLINWASQIFLVKRAIEDRKSTRLNSSHSTRSRMPSSA